jgi:hypothetical protein
MLAAAANAKPKPFRANAGRLARLPRGLGRDLIEVLYGGWLDENETLWERYGNPYITPDLLNRERLGSLLHSSNTELRLYVAVADLVARTMRMSGALSHAGTEYRIASTIIGELSGVGTRLCRHCGGSGRRKRSGVRCRQCGGDGLVRPSNSRRAAECGCRQPEFVAGLLGVYLTVLARMRRELARALAAYEKG